MRDIIACFSEHATDVSESSCSSYSGNACISPSLTPSVQTAVTCLHKVTLSTHKQLLVAVTWCKNHSAQGLSLTFGNDPSAASFKLNTNSRLFRKKKGNKVIESDNAKIEVFWDLSSAKYETGPEPTQGFYVLIMLDSEIGLIMGDIGEEPIAKKFRTSTPVAKVRLISRQEHCSGNALYATKAQFCDTGIQHDILIKCSGEKEGLKYPLLLVSFDKKMVIRVKRLHWNFRGSQTIFVDGLLVDLLWDVHDWFFNPGSGSAVFMFRARCGMDGRLRWEEKLEQKDQERGEFSLLIYACKSP